MSQIQVKIINKYFSCDAVMEEERFEPFILAVKDTVYHSRRANDTFSDPKKSPVKVTIKKIESDENPK